jgi:hypothetical protein
MLNVVPTIRSVLEGQDHTCAYVHNPAMCIPYGAIRKITIMSSLGFTDIGHGSRLLLLFFN